MAVIIGQNVSKIYHTRRGHKQILTDQDFVIKRGDSIGILGPNGAGKSTLLRMIAGVEYPTAGNIRREMTVSWPIGFSGAFQVSLTGADNARFIARVYGQPIKDVLTFVEDFAELGHYLYEPVKTYSSGMSSRLAFGISLAVDFDCYLVDEVTAVGDARFQQRCRDALLARQQRGALVLTSHDLHTLRDYCNAGWVLRDTHIHKHDNIEDAIAAYNDLLGVH
jgi:capsular polysaccharide transport system ATP-binding protein